MKEIIKLSILVFLLGCHSEMDEEEFVKWCTDYQNGIHVKKEVKEYYFDVQYQPEEYLRILRNEKPNQHTNNIEQYRLKIGLNDKSIDILNYLSKDLQERKRIEYYLSYRFHEDIKLVVGEQKIQCQIFQFEKALRKDNAIIFTAGFPELTKGLDATFQIDSEIFSALPIKIQINKSQLPEIKI